MPKRMKSRILALIVSLIMVIALLVVMPVSVVATGLSDDIFSMSNYNIEQDNREFIEYSILTSTMRMPVGMQGFEGNYAINDSNEIVEIIVQFSTPSAVALRLMQEKGIPFNTIGRTLPNISFEEQALSAHEAFKQQLAQIPVPFGGAGIEIFEEHYWLFNGVFMRLPGGMVELIAELPGVYGVFPNVAFYTTYSSYAAHTQYHPFFVNPDVFMRQTREFLNMDYINNEMGITGAGVRVAVVDTGIYHAHPEFERFLDDTGRIPGWRLYNGDYHYNSYETDVTIAIPDIRAHGTTVSGAVIGIAPGIELWNYRVSLGGVRGMSPFEGISVAHRGGADIINMSFGNAGNNHPFDPFASVVNTAVLDGTVVIVSAGNHGAGGYYTINNSNAATPFSIAVGAGSAGGVFDPFGNNDDMQNYSSSGPVRITHHIKPDIIAPTNVVTTNIGGGYSFGSGGTSHAAPIITGTAALLIEAFPDADPQEIRARIMNTARYMTGTGTDSVFSTGAGFVRPLEALRAETIVTVEHYIPISSNPNDPFVSATMSSLSFGEVSISNHGTFNNIIPIFVENRGDACRTYTIVPYFQNNPNGAANLIISTNTISVVAGDTEQVNAVLIFNGDVPVGFYEGFLYVRDGAIVVARLPFAAVVTEPFRAPDAPMVSFELNGTEANPTNPQYIKPLQVIANMFIMQASNFPNNPERIGYVFMGWYMDGEFIVPLTEETVMPAYDTILYAKWELGYKPPNIFQVRNHEELEYAVQHLVTQGITEQTTIRMMQNFAATGRTVEIPRGVNVVLTSSPGNVFTYTRPIMGRHFEVRGTLTLQNVVLCGDFAEINPDFSSFSFVRGGVAVHGSGGGSGHLIMEDGSVITNSAVGGLNGGGAVSVSGNNLLHVAFTMRGGIIENNSAFIGAGVHVQEGTFNMTGGTIRNNHAVFWDLMHDFPNRPSGAGGGVSMTVNSRLNMSGGIIEDNTATFGGGIGGNIHLNMTGGEIRNNTADYGGGIWMRSTRNGVSISGGYIRDNHAAYDGGGIFTITGSNYQNPMPGYAYFDLIIISAARFAGNTAGNGAFAPPVNALAIMPRASLVSIFDHQLNNYDINFVYINERADITAYAQSQDELNEIPELYSNGSNYPYLPDDYDVGVDINFQSIEN